jgi:signal transduction histidine kinase
MLTVAIVSLAVTVQFARTGHPGWAGATLLEIVALSVPITLLIRSARLAPGVVACCVFAGVADSAVILRYVDGTLPMSLASMALWSLPAAGAGGAGLYLRVLDARRARAVIDQRIALAHDLHDFVAHDITGVVVQAQAARMVVDRDPQRTVDVLERIETSGLRALGSIDRALDFLRDQGGAASSGADLRSLSELARGFRAGGGTDVRLAADPQILNRLSAEAASTVYRFMVETLTNVRRHAPGAKCVDVEITAEQRAVVLAVTNDLARSVGSGSSRPAGAGLTHLAERITALGGHLTAGPIDGGRWRVVGELPVGR